MDRTERFSDEWVASLAGALRNLADVLDAGVGAPEAEPVVERCPKGHVYTEQTTAYLANGRKRCRTCANLASRKSRQRVAIGEASAETCPNGHPYTEQTTSYYRGKKKCRICMRIATEKSREKRRRRDGEGIGPSA